MGDMTPDTRDKILSLFESDPWKFRPEMEKLMETVDIIEEPKGNRTGAQNSALHVDCALIASKLNESGLDMRTVLKPTYSLPWTPESVKQHIWKPIMKALYGHESTRDLKKVEEIDRIHEVIMRELGEKHHIEWHDFPSDDKKQLEALSGYKLSKRDYDYPEEDLTPTI